jgi:hypothetical protein
MQAVQLEAIMQPAAVVCHISGALLSEDDMQKSA